MHSQQNIKKKKVWYLVGVSCSSSSSRMQKPHLKPRKYNNFVSIRTVLYELAPSLAAVLFVLKNMVLLLHSKNTWIKPLASYIKIKKEQRFVYILVSYCDNDGAMKGK